MAEILQVYPVLLKFSGHVKQETFPEHSVSSSIEAQRKEMIRMAYANCECSDQPSHPRSLISAFSAHPHILQ